MYPSHRAEQVIDAHWRPFYLRCGYCEAEYDVIGKMETFEDDLKFIFESKNLTMASSSNSDNHFLRKKFNSKQKMVGGSQAERIKTYFEILPPRLRSGLKELYNWDFELFGYESEPYMWYMLMSCGFLTKAAYFMIKILMVLFFTFFKWCHKKIGG